MTICQICGNDNQRGSQYCDECGAGINGLEQRESGPLQKTIQPNSADTPLFRSANVTSLGVPAIEDRPDKSGVSDENALGQANSNIHAELEIERGEGGGRRFALISGESHIGRWDADNGIFPDVDLDAYDTEAKVSRRHARIILAGGKYSIEDLGSTNGTYINRGKRLIPGVAHILNDGDEIIVGKIFLRFSIAS